MIFPVIPMFLFITLAMPHLLIQLSFAQSNPTNKFKTLSGNAPLIIGHRGAPAFGGENTLAGFKKAVKELGADGFEIDIMPTRDGKLIVSHDYELTRLIGKDQLEDQYPEKALEGNGGKQWLVTDFTQNELNQLKVTYPPAGIDERLNYKNLDSDFRMPFLGETLELFTELKEATNNQELKIYIEIKMDDEHVNNSQFPAIINELEAKLKDNNLLNKGKNVWIQSFDAELMTLIGQEPLFDNLPKTQLIGGNEPEFRDISSETQLRNFLEQHVKNKNLDILHMSKIPFRILVEKHHIDVAGIVHDMGLQVHLYTFRDRGFYSGYHPYRDLTGLSGFHSAIEELIYYYQQGVDAVMSDYVVSAKEALELMKSR